ncbi:hypothetical protein FRB93_000922 [Tulasnella sp. JGI-2019a]|nr:hypothetical protein FRB93_000922 [Tulasnella sp. JGI-2019a]
MNAPWQAQWELFEAVVLTPEEWTTDNQMVTATQMINSKMIAEKYKEQIKACPSGLSLSSTEPLIVVLI